MRRKAELEELLRFAEFSKNEIFYCNSTIDKIIENKKCCEIGAFFKDLALSEEHMIGEKYNKTKEKYRKITSLSKDDIRCRDYMFEILGKTDSDEQTKMLSESITELKDRRKEASVNCESLGSMYIKMGIAVGFFAVIICI